MGTIPARVDRSRGSPLVAMLVALAWMAAAFALDGNEPAVVLERL